MTLMVGSLSIARLRKNVLWFDADVKIEDYGDKGMEQHQWTSGGRMIGSEWE